MIDRRVKGQGVGLDELARDMERIEDLVFAQELRLSRLSSRVGGSDIPHHPPMPENRRKERMRA